MEKATIYGPSNAQLLITILSASSKALTDTVINGGRNGIITIIIQNGASIDDGKGKSVIINSENSTKLNITLIGGSFDYGKIYCPISSTLGTYIMH